MTLSDSLSAGIVLTIAAQLDSFPFCSSTTALWNRIFGTLAYLPGQNTSTCAEWAGNSLHSIENVPQMAFVDTNSSEQDILFLDINISKPISNPQRSRVYHEWEYALNVNCLFVADINFAALKSLFEHFHRGLK